MRGWRTKLLFIGAGFARVRQSISWEQTMAFKNRQDMDGIFLYMIHDPVIAQKNFAHFPVGSFRHDSSRKWSFSGLASAFTQPFDPHTGRTRVIPRYESADVQQVPSCPVGPKKFHGSGGPRTSSSSPASVASSINRPAAESDNPSSRASRNRACSLRRSNSAGVSSTAAGFPF